MLGRPCVCPVPYFARHAAVAPHATGTPPRRSWNGIFSIGSVCHGALGGGTRPFKTGGSDQSTNVWWIALPTFGDGWHNNHHAFSWSARHGLHWYEPDVTYCVLRGLEKLGIVWDLKVPTAVQIEMAQRPRPERLRQQKGAGAEGAGPGRESADSPA